jgi:hypothetical protein
MDTNIDTKKAGLFGFNLQNNRNSILIFLGGCIFYISYIVYIHWNMPFFDTMFDFLWLPDKFYEKNLSLEDFRFRYGEHGMLGYDLLYLINALLFNLSMRFDLIINTVMVILCGLITTLAYHKSIASRNIGFYLGYILILFAMFSPLQGSANGMSIQIRLGMTLAFITIYLAENIYQNKSSSFKLKVVLYALIFSSYFIFGTFYTFSWIASIVVVYAVRITYGKIKRIPTPYKDYCIEIILMSLCVLLYFFIFKPSIGKQPIEDRNNIFVSLIYLLRFIVISAGSVTFPWDTIADGKIGETLLLINSIYVTIFTIIAIIIYLKVKMWEKTLLPIIMIFYTLAGFSQIYLGRSQGDMFFVYNSWYNVHTKFFLTAVIWIYIYAILEKKGIDIGSFIIKPEIVKVLSICLILILLIPCFVGFNLFNKRAPHIKAWIEGKIPYLIGEVALTVDANGYTELLIPYEKTIKGIELLKKYKLNIFRNDNYRNIPLYNGFYGAESGGSRWINGNARIIVRGNSTATRFSLNGYYPENWPENNITVTVNNKESVTVEMIPGDQFTLELDFENSFDNELYIDLKTEKTFIPKDEGWGEDGRELGAIITSWSLSE